jgi:NAD(P)H-dependent FMN reductase
MINPPTWATSSSYLTVGVNALTVISVIVGSAPRGSSFGKARQLDFATSEEAPGRRRSASRSSVLSHAVLRSADNAGTPGRAPYGNAVVQRWTAAIAQSDGFVFVTPEYNFGTSAVLKNAIDRVYAEWIRKAVDFVSYGSAMGARAVQ